MRKSTISKVLALALMGFTYQAFGTCKKIYGNFNLTYETQNCYEIYGSNLTFDGNGHTIFGNTAETSNIIVAVYGSNVTVKNVYIDCNTKSTGMEFDNAGTSQATDISVSNCYTGVQKNNTNLVVSGIKNGANNMFNNSIAINSFDGTSTYIYTSALDGTSNSKGIGIHVDGSPFYDYASQFYFNNVGMIANNNSFFWLDHSFFVANKFRDLMLYNIKSAYMTGVFYQTAVVYNTNIIKN